MRVFRFLPAATSLVGLAFAGLLPLSGCGGSTASEAQAQVSPEDEQQRKQMYDFEQASKKHSKTHTAKTLTRRR